MPFNLKGIKKKKLSTYKLGIYFYAFFFCTTLLIIFKLVHIYIDYIYFIVMKYFNIYFGHKVQSIILFISRFYQNLGLFTILCTSFLLLKKIFFIAHLLNYSYFLIFIIYQVGEKLLKTKIN